QIVKVFQALSNASLQCFLGEAHYVCVDEVQEFITNAVVNEEAGTISSTVCGTSIFLSEEIFAGLFDLNNEGTSVLTDVQDAEIDKMLQVFGKEPLTKRSGKKMELKPEFRLLHEVINKG
ncbi:hypothetical protein, partial [Serratia marcescens]|uniref:hypothetical protein n=1 Tax=Serratia marcescens TaxID=615 RepID=UPI0028132E02